LVHRYEASCKTFRDQRLADGANQINATGHVEFADGLREVLLLTYHRGMVKAPRLSPEPVAEPRTQLHLEPPVPLHWLSACSS